MDRKELKMCAIFRMSTFYKSNQLQALLFRALYLCSALNNHRYWKPNLSLSIRRGNNKYPINPIINAKLNLTSKKRKMLDIWNSWDCTWKNINCFTISCIDYNRQIFLNQLLGSVFVFITNWECRPKKIRQQVIS